MLILNTKKITLAFVNLTVNGSSFAYHTRMSDFPMQQHREKLSPKVVLFEVIFQIFTFL